MKQANQTMGPYSMVRIKYIEKQGRLIKSFGQLSSEKVSLLTSSMENVGFYTLTKEVNQPVGP